MSDLLTNNANSQVKLTEKLSVNIDGTQSIRRSLAILRIVSSYREEGIHLARIVKESGINRGTAHRILKALIAEGFVFRDLHNKYLPGAETMLLSSLLPNPKSILVHFEPILRRIAQESGDTTFLLMRKGDYMFVNVRPTHLATSTFSC